jgi:Uma2 family endonuclease
MRVSSIRRGWTYSDFARLGRDERNRYEVIAGEVFATPVQSPLHQGVLTNVLCDISGFVDDHDLGVVLLGPVDVLLGDGDYLCPDVVFVRRERLGILSDRGIEAAPDLVIEITSPGTAERDRGIKLARYGYYGVPRCWVVDPERGVLEVYDFLSDARTPVVYADRFTWQPFRDGPVAEFDVPEWTQDW